MNNDGFVIGSAQECELLIHSRPCVTSLLRNTVHRGIFCQHAPYSVLVMSEFLLFEKRYQRLLNSGSAFADKQIKENV